MPTIAEPAVQPSWGLLRRLIASAIDTWRQAHRVTTLHRHAREQLDDAEDHLAYIADLKRDLRRAQDQMESLDAHATVAWENYRDEEQALKARLAVVAPSTA